MPVVLPIRHQPALPSNLILAQAPGAEAIELDVLIVGAGPAGLSCAIALARQAPELAIGVLEKAAALGEHILSGAVINPVVMQLQGILSTHSPEIVNVGAFKCRPDLVFCFQHQHARCTVLVFF